MALGRKTGGRDWKPGESGNPNGRPPQDQALTTLLRESVNKDELVATLMTMAKDNFQALKYVYDRLDGKPVETVREIIETPRVIGYYPQSTDTEDTEANQQLEEI